MANPIRAYLEATGRSIQSIAEAAGIERTIISRVVSGVRKKFSLRAAKALAPVTGISVERLMGLEDGDIVAIRTSRADGRRGGRNASR